MNRDPETKKVLQFQKTKLKAIFEIKSKQTFWKSFLVTYPQILIQISLLMLSLEHPMIKDWIIESTMAYIAQNKYVLVAIFFINTLGSLVLVIMDIRYSTPLRF